MVTQLPMQTVFTASVALLVGAGLLLMVTSLVFPKLTFRLTRQEPMTISVVGLTLFAVGGFVGVPGDLLV